MITHCSYGSLFNEDTQVRSFWRWFLPFLGFSTAVKMRFHFEISFSASCHQGAALVLVPNRSKRQETFPIFSFFISFLLHSFTPGVKVTFQPYATHKQFKPKSLIRSRSCRWQWVCAALEFLGSCTSGVQEKWACTCSAIPSAGLKSVLCCSFMFSVVTSGQIWSLGSREEAPSCTRDDGDAALEHSSPRSAIWRGRVRREGGGEDRGGLKGYLREWLSCKLSVQDTELWLAEPENGFFFQHRPNKTDLPLSFNVEAEIPPGGTRGTPGKPRSVSGVLSCPDPLSNPREPWGLPYSGLNKGWLAEGKMESFGKQLEGRQQGC